MKTRLLKENSEYSCSEENGEEIRCPICSALWMRDCEGDVTFGRCQHLRFKLFFAGSLEFEYFGRWKRKSFEISFEQSFNDGSEKSVEETFRSLKHPDLSGVVYWAWDDFPLVQWTIYWGYKG